MATHAVIKYHIPVFWDEEFKTLEYVQEPFNDPAAVKLWSKQGYSDKITGELCDMRRRLPACANKFVEIYTAQGWKDIGLAFYRMSTGTVMPVHQDTYKRYIKLFDLKGQEQSIQRALVFPEAWKSGHYLEVNGQAFVNWKAGDTIEWTYDTPHAAANIGLEDRYSLQITGHV